MTQNFQVIAFEDCTTCTEDMFRKPRPTTPATWTKQNALAFINRQIADRKKSGKPYKSRGWADWNNGPRNILLWVICFRIIIFTKAEVMFTGQQFYISLSRINSYSYSMYCTYHVLIWHNYNNYNITTNTPFYCLLISFY